MASASQLQVMLDTFHSRYPDQVCLYPFVASELAICSHTHQLLVTIINGKGDLPLTGLHHWSPQDASISRVIQSNSGTDDLRYVHGFQELGTFWLPKSKASSLNDIHHYLDSLIPRRQNTLESETTESILTALGGQRDAELSQPMIPIQFFTIAVHGNAKDELFNGGLVPIWKWIKSQSTYYHRRGCWEANVDTALDCEELEQTKERHLLVCGMPEETEEGFRTGESVYPFLPPRLILAQTQYFNGTTE